MLLIGTWPPALSFDNNVDKRKHLAAFATLEC